MDRAIAAEMAAFNAFEASGTAKAYYAWMMAIAHVNATLTA